MLQRLHFEARSLVSCIYTHHGVERARNPVPLPQPLLVRDRIRFHIPNHEPLQTLALLVRLPGLLQKRGRHDERVYASTCLSRFKRKHQKARARGNPPSVRDATPARAFCGNKGLRGGFVVVGSDTTFRQRLAFERCKCQVITFRERYV